MQITIQPGDCLTVRCGDQGVKIHGYSTSSDLKRLSVGWAYDLPASPDSKDRSIVQVNLGGRRFCYQNPDDAKLGDLVRVVLPSGAPKYVRVMDYGRGAYRSTVYKACELVTTQARKAGA
jgi:hypothetical protein